MSDQIEIPDIDDLPDMPETAEFTPAVKLLTTQTPVLGYDGANINPANWQAKALADRTQWLRDRLLSLSTRLVMSVNGKTGNVVVTYNDVGADAAGTTDALMTAHVTALDPHSQYFDEARGDARYVQRSLANQSNGWLQLDASGKIPASMLQTLVSRHVVVANQAARLALSQSVNLTICAQADINQLFYLNGGLNPAVSANWVAGQSATVSGVSSVYGRTGAVTAQNGDYDADKITETATRKFASPTEKTAWNAKQSALVSGTNIRSLFGNSLLGSGNLTPTPAQMGSAATVHTHTTADITDYTQKTQQLITASLEAGTGVTLGYNPVNGKTIISASGGGSGGSGYIVIDRPNSTAGQNHSFNFSAQSDFNLTAYALKEVAGATSQTYVVDEFSADSENNYKSTDDLFFDGSLREYTGGTYSLNSIGGFYRADVKFNSKSIRIRSDIYGTVVPQMTSNTTPAGYVASASSNYNSSFPAYGAFDRTSARQWASSTGDATPFIMIELAHREIVDKYVITKYNSTMTASPVSWVFQGSNNGTDWVTVDTVNDYNNIPASDKISRDFANENSYSKYRFIFNKKYEQYVQLREIELLPKSARFLIIDGDKKYTVENEKFIELTGELTNALINSKGLIDTNDIEIPNGFSSTVSVVSSRQTDVMLKYVPHSQIAVQKLLVSAAAWGQINSATLTATQTNNGFVRVAVTRDLVNWHAWRGGAWIDVGSLSADTASATKLITDGMTPSDLNGINATGWSQLFSANNNVPDFLAFAFALDISDPATDVATIDRLTLNVNESSRWMLQTAAQVEISWRTDSVTFRTVNAGNYKLAYQIP